MSLIPIYLPLYGLAFLLSAGLSYAVARYGAAWLADEPRRHSSHRRMVPRGGGLGVAVVLLAALFGAGAGVARNADWRLIAGAIALVATIGLLDDRFELGVVPRLVAHLIAGVLVALAPASDVPLDPVRTIMVAVAVAWSINLHNFMDGANGLLATHGMLVLAALAFLGLLATDPLLALIAGVAAAGAAGFLPFNLPRARVFLGDVGSGTIGLAIALALLLADRGATLPLPAGLLLASAFVVDASATLVSRMLRGRRWYTRHREHLYQWLMRRGASHGAVTMAYAAFTGVIALPSALWVRTLEPVAAWAVCGAFHLVALGLWWYGKAALLRQARSARA
jgi:UDP-N-acetylmuramyl pentapeptide phosphotransferase/UDP-N-acetylglucosamine-1-phosphate transferase